MAVSIVKSGDGYESPVYKEFIIDDSNDVDSLPSIEECAPGSVANSIDGVKYVLSPTGEWKVMSSSSGTITVVQKSGASAIYSEEITVSTTDSAGIVLLTPAFTLPSSGTYPMLYATIEDTAGIRNGYFYRSETVMDISSGATTTAARGIVTYVGGANSSTSAYSYGGGSIAYGLFISSCNTTDKTFKIYARYNSEYSGKFNGTYKVRVYVIKQPTEG